MKAALVAAAAAFHLFDIFSGKHLVVLLIISLLKNLFGQLFFLGQFSKGWLGISRPAEMCVIALCRRFLKLDEWGLVNQK